MQVHSWADISNHNKINDCWIVIKDNVYDVTKFLDRHPGGKKIILGVAGKDATKQFVQFHNVPILLKKYDHLKVGRVEGSEKFKDTNSDGKFGSDIPFAEPAWYRGFASPYYNDSHRAWRAKVRAFVEKEISPYAPTWDEEKDYPRDLHVKAYEAGIFGCYWPKQYGGTPPEGGVCDLFHEFIFWDELLRCGCGGVIAACFLTISIALPPILTGGSDEMKAKVATECITGKKIIALAVTEPFAGSDVANIETTARREGDFYIVNGQKKFITSGMKADYFTTAVRTGPAGMGGLSLLLIESNSPGIKLNRLPTQGWWASNTAHIVFEDVKVPVKNLIGKENQGFLQIMLNFNHERWVGCVQTGRSARLCIEEAISFARNRKTFGKRLIDHQVIRHKIAEMASRVEAYHSNLEHITYQMQNGVDGQIVGGPIALLKVQATKMLELCAREASQILGGASYVRGPSTVGSKVERIYREVRVGAIGGGSEEIMLDLASRQAKL